RYGDRLCTGAGGRAFLLYERSRGAAPKSPRTRAAAADQHASHAGRQAGRRRLAALIAARLFRGGADGHVLQVLTEAAYSAGARAVRRTAAVAAMLRLASASCSGCKVPISRSQSVKWVA